MFVLFPVPGAYAADGDLDPSCGTGGKVIAGVTGTSNSYVGNSVAIQKSDGKIVVAGTSQGDFTLLRYNTDCTLDTSFDTDGIVTTVFTTTHVTTDKAFAVAIQTTDNKIVVVGSSEANFALARYNTNGALDNTFGISGTVTINFHNIKIGFRSAVATAVAIQKDGKIVVAGYVDNSSEFNDWVVVRFNTDGTLDTSFGTGGNGIVTTSIKVQEQDQAYGVVIQPADDKIVVVGDTKGSPGQFAMARYNSDGTLDTSFGTGGDGKVFAASTQVATGRAVVIDSNNKIVVTGAKYVKDLTSDNCIDSMGHYCEYLDFWLARFNPDGSPDTACGTDGETTTEINGRGNDDQADALALQTGERIVVAGYSDTSVHTFTNNGNDEHANIKHAFSLARYNQNCALDNTFGISSTFGISGTVMTNFSAGSDDQGHAVAIQTDAKIVVTGGSDKQFALARYNTSFSVGGTVSGLTGIGLVLQNNGGDDLSIGANGAFTFTTQLTDGAAYTVTVKTQPNGQSCTVTNGSGTLAGANVTNVAVSCGTSPDSFSVGGTVSGLTGIGLVLQNNGGDDLAIGANGAFTFTTQLTDGAAYAVTVKTQPNGQSCTVTNGSGTLAGANVTNVAVSCGTSSGSFSVGGTVSGLTGIGLVLQNNGGDNLAIGANGAFTFTTQLADGAAYAVTVKTQPNGQSCTVTNGSGTLAGANVTNVAVSCTESAQSKAYYLPAIQR